MFLCLTIATLLLSALTVLPLWQHPHWTIRSLDFPRLQLAACAALIIGAQLAFLEYENAGTWALVLTTSLCLAWHLRWILPYTPLWPEEVASYKGESNGRCLSIITANVLTPNRHADKLIALVRHYRPDVLVTLESDAWWQEQLDALAPEMPHTIKHPLDNLYGMHVYSRLPLHEKKVSFLVEEDVPSMHALIFDNPAVQKDQRPAGPPGGQGHVQHLPCRISAAPLAPGPRLPQPPFYRADHPASAGDRIRPFPTLYTIVPCPVERGRTGGLGNKRPFGSVPGPASSLLAVKLKKRSSF